MVVGIVLYSVSFLMIGPWEVLFSNKWLVIASLPLIGTGYSLASGDLYTVPAVPHMLEVSTKDYLYRNDDRLNDALSTVMNVCDNVGEILGPLAAGVLVNFFPFSSVSAAIGFILFGYGILYLALSGSLSAKCSPSRIAVVESLLSNHS